MPGLSFERMAIALSTISSVVIPGCNMLSTCPHTFCVSSFDAPERSKDEQNFSTKNSSFPPAAFVISILTSIALLFGFKQNTPLNSGVFCYTSPRKLKKIIARDFASQGLVSEPLDRHTGALVRRRL